MFNIYVKRCNSDVRLPTRAYPTDLGFDIYAPFHFDIEAGKVREIPLGISLEFPVWFDTNGDEVHWGGLLWPKSGLARDYGLKVLGGAVDPDYRGNIIAILENSGDKYVAFRQGDKILQLIPVMSFPGGIVEVGDGEELSQTARGTGGLGSSGVR